MVLAFHQCVNKGFTVRLWCKITIPTDLINHACMCSLCNRMEKSCIYVSQNALDNISLLDIGKTCTCSPCTRICLRSGSRVFRL